MEIMNIFTLIQNKILKATKEDLSSVTSLAIGCFDALHLGHFELIKRLDENGALLIIYKKTKEIVPIFYKQELLNCKVFFVNLDEIKEESAYNFTQNIMYNFTQLKYFVAGYDFHFGKNRAAHAKELKSFSGLDCIVVDEYKINGISVHSSLIRECLLNANLKDVKTYLGRNYYIKGKQIKGQGLGAKFFVPTINVDYENYFLPKAGVYYAKVFLDENEYLGAVFLGKRSTDEKEALEVHILNNSNSYFKFQQIKIEFLEFFRENKKFDDFDSLKAQIDLDIKALSLKAKNER